MVRVDPAVATEKMLGYVLAELVGPERRFAPDHL
jgi:hypothetical protein